MTSLAALDFLVCLKSDVFVMTHGGNFAKLIIGARRYMGHRLKSIKPDKGLMSKSFGDPYMGWATFVEEVWDGGADGGKAEDELEKVVFMCGFDKEGHPVCYNI